MSKLTRNTSDETSREFWQNVDKGAAEIEEAPRWMKAGISLNAQHFHTYAAQQRDSRPLDERSSDDK